MGTCLQQGNDLLPNLVETVKGYAGQEKNTLVEVMNAVTKVLQQARLKSRTKHLKD